MSQNCGNCFYARKMVLPSRGPSGAPATPVLACCFPAPMWATWPEPVTPDLWCGEWSADGQKPYIPGPPGPEGPPGPAGPPGPEGPPNNSLPQVIPPGVALVDQAAPIEQQTPIFISPNRAVYRLSLYLAVTKAADVGTLGVTLFWVDDTFGQSISTGQVQLVKGAFLQQTYVLQLVAGSPVNYTVTSIAGITGSPLYNLDIIVERLT